MYVFLPFLLSTLISGLLGYLTYRLLLKNRAGIIVTLISSAFIAYIFIDLYAFFGVVGGVLFYILLIRISTK